MGQHSEVLPDLERLIREHPLRERLWAHLMLARYRSGRQAEALDAFREARELLSDELGIDPSPELQELQRRILQQEPGEGPQAVGGGQRGDAAIRTFLIADVRGYTVFTQERGDEAAAALAGKFAGVAREGVEARGGTVVELRGDEALAVFDSARQAIRAAVELQRRFVDETVADPTLPLAVGIGLDAGEAVAVEGGYRGGALNLAARLCSIAGPAEILASPAVTHLARKVDGVAYVDRGSVHLKGLADPVQVIRLRAEATTPRTTWRSVGRSARRPPASRPPSPVRSLANPYKGLRAFEEGDAADFFGREELVEELVKRREADPVPRGRRAEREREVLRRASRADPGAPARRDRRLGGVAHRGHVPGRPPAGRTGGGAPSRRAGPTGEPDGAARARRARAPPRGPPTPAVGRERARPRDRPVRGGVHARRGRGRADALPREPRGRRDRSAQPPPRGRHPAGRLLRPAVAVPGFAELFKSRVEAVVPLSAEELERAISGPAKRVDVSLEPGLVAAMLADVAEEPGALPLMEYALTELFERRDGRTLFLEAYRQIGGVSGALGRRAEELYAELDDDGKEAARQLFLRLVALGEGTEDTRRRVPRAEVASLDVDQQAMATVLDTFGASRQLSFDRDARTGEPTIELAHEAILTAWPRLHRWIDAAREDLRTERRVADGRARMDRVRPGRLVPPERLASGPGRGLAGELGDRRHAGGARVPRRLARGARPSDRPRRRRASAHERDLERRSVRRLRAVVAILAVAAVIAGALTVFAIGQSSRAASEERNATARELAAASVANLEVDPERSILLALEAIETTREPDGIVLPEAEEALHRAMVASRDRADRAGPRRDPRLEPEGRTSSRRDRRTRGTIDLRDETTGDSVRSWIGHENSDVNDVKFSPDGSMLATAGDDGFLKMWDPETGELIFEVEGGRAGWRGCPSTPMEHSSRPPGPRRAPSASSRRRPATSCRS